MIDLIRLPDDIETGASGGPCFQTTILSMASGKEKRNVDWQQARFKADISYGIQSMDDLRAVYNFFHARQGKARGFLFKNWIDYKAVNQQIGVGNGVQTSFQLVKTYTSVITYTKNIFYPVASSLVIKVGGDEVSKTLHENGLVTITAPLTDAIVTADFEFDLAVRFDFDELEVTMEQYETGSLPNMSIVEIIE